MIIIVSRYFCGGLLFDESRTAAIEAFFGFFTARITNDCGRKNIQNEITHTHTHLLKFGM